MYYSSFKFGYFNWQVYFIDLEVIVNSLFVIAIINFSNIRQVVFSLFMGLVIGCFDQVSYCMFSYFYFYSIDPSFLAKAFTTFTILFKVSLVLKLWLAILWFL